MTLATDRAGRKRRYLLQQKKVAALVQRSKQLGAKAFTARKHAEEYADRADSLVRAQAILHAQLENETFRLQEYREALSRDGKPSAEDLAARLF